MPTVLMPLADGFEEIEALAPVDLLRRAGVEVIIASLSDSRHATGRSGVTVHADLALSAWGERLADCLLLPGGPGVQALREDRRVGSLLRRHAAAGRWLAAICAAPILLQDAGLLEGRRFTAHFSVAEQLPSALLDRAIVTDGRLITARGAGASLEFGLRLVEVLVSGGKASEVGKAICF